LSAHARLVLVTDPSFSTAHTDAVIATVAAAVPRGAFAVQLRDKVASPEAFRARAVVLRDLTRALGVDLIINGPVELACDLDAGVHLPGGSRIAPARRVLGERRQLTCAAHDDDDVRRAASEGADAVLVSPIFATPGKGPARGLGAIASACAIAHASDRSARRLSIFALGGVDGSNAGMCSGVGASGVAVVRALLAAPDPAAVARVLLAGP
jgi:thiamine-phosphate pyrophosphorylase